MTSRPLRIVSLAPFRPNRSATHAGGVFYGRYLEALDREAEVSCFVMTDEPVATLDVPVDLALHEIPALPPPWLDRRRHGVELQEIVRGLRLPAPAVYAWLEDPVLQEHLDRADVVEVQWGQLLPLLRPLRARLGGTPLVPFLHDVMSQSRVRLRDADRAAGHRKLSGLATAAMPAVRRSERRLLQLASAFAVPSEKDAALVHGLGVDRPHVVFELTPDPRPQPAPPVRDPVALVSGAMWRRENFEGALSFAREGWPAVRAQVPDARLRVVGSRPVPELQALHGVDGIEVVGWVDDLAAEYDAARLLVAPLWQGAGVKVKVLEALSAGRPVVGTPVAAEGLHTPSGGAAPLRLGADPAALAARVVELLREPASCDALGVASWEWSRTLRTLDDTVADVLQLYRSLAGR